MEENDFSKFGFDIFDMNSNTSESMKFDKSAKLLKGMYDSLTNAGFNDKQAMKIISSILSEIAIGVAGKDRN